MKKYLFSILLTVFAATTLVSCLNDDDTDKREVVAIDYTAGAFILNEGNYYNQVNGSLSYLDYNSYGVTNGLFKTKNNRALGGTPNSLAMTAGYMFIATTDDNTVEAVDGNLKSAGQIKINQPRELAVDSQYVFVSSYDGCVYKVSAKDKQIVTRSEKIGACLEGIALRGDYIYVCNAYNSDYTYNTNVVKLKASTLEKVADIEVPCNPTTLKLSGDNLYVLSSGNYADVKSQVSRIDKDDKVTYLCDATLFDVIEGTVVGINSITDWEKNETKNEYFTYTKDGKKAEFKPSASVPSPCSIAVDPVTGYILIGSYKLTDKGTPDYSGNGLMFLFAGISPTSQYLRFDVGVGPTNILFNIEKLLTYK